KGKANVAEVLKQSLADLKGHKLRSTITSLHFLRPDVAIADGKAEIIAPDGTADSGRFTSTWTKTDGKWLLSAVRDLPESSTDQESAPGQLNQLEWLAGEWLHEGPTFTAQVSGRWALDKSFLQLEYTVKGKNNDRLNVIQYFGWDPIEEVVHSW